MEFSLAGAQESLLKDCHTNFVRTFESVANGIPGGKIERVEGVSIVSPGLPGFDMVFALDLPGSLKRVSEAIERNYGDTTRWSLVTTQETSEAFTPLIRELGLEKVRDEPGMVLDPIPDWYTLLPRDLVIHRVTEQEEMRAFVKAGGMFGMAIETLEPLADTVASGIRNGTFRGGCYLGYHSGRPVATSMRCTFGMIAGVYFVTTLPEFRNRGIGGAMTWRAAVDGKREEGCVASFLQASDMGRPVYERMGYRIIVNYQVWRKQAAKS